MAQHMPQLATMAIGVFGLRAGADPLIHCDLMDYRSDHGTTARSGPQLPQSTDPSGIDEPPDLIVLVGQGVQVRQLHVQLVSVVG